MIDILTALGWLKAADNTTHLNKEYRRLIRQVLSSAPTDDKVKLLVERLRTAALASKDPLEKSEILLYCAAIGFGNGWYPQSARYANAATISYVNDDHRRAVALWILGIVQWELLQNQRAYTSWDAAREIFQRRQIVYQRLPDERDWYEKKLQQMNIDFAARPEEIMTWLNRFEASSLRCSSQQFVKGVQERIRARTDINLYELAQDLQQAIKQSRGAYEMAEVCLEFGLAFYQLGNMHAAMELLRKAVEKFYAGIRGYHKQEVARCMLGTLEWKQKSLQKQAFVDCTRSIEAFEELQGWADRDELKEKEYWYTQHCVILKAALAERLPRQYQDLLFLVENDSSEANRLISLELRKFPQDDLGQLIERAIEGVLIGRK